MRFAVAKAAGLMSIDNTSFPVDTTSLASNVTFVIFNADDGEITYGGAPGVNVSVSDPSPYQPLINAWLTAASEAAAPLTLAQAQTIKGNLVTTIYDAKRQSPITYDSYQWDCSDQAIAALNQAAIAALITGTNAALSALDASLTALLNTVIVNVNTAISDDGNVPSVSEPSPPTVPGALAWTPIGASSPLTLTGAQASDLLSAIAARRALLLAAQQTALAALTATTTIAQVIAFDITAGWPF
jgi:hypothetical protein